MKYPSHVDRTKMDGISPEQFFTRVDLVRSYKTPLVRERLDSSPDSSIPPSRTAVYALTLEDAFTVYWYSRQEKTFEAYMHAVLYFFAEGLSRMCIASREHSIWVQKEGYKALSTHVSDMLWEVVHTHTNWSTTYSDNDAMRRNSHLLLEMFRTMQSVFEKYQPAWSSALAIQRDAAREKIHHVYPSKEIALGEHSFFFLDALGHLSSTSVMNIWKRAQKDMAPVGGAYRVHSPWSYCLKYWFEPLFMESNDTWRARYLDALASDVYSGFGLDHLSQNLGFFFSEDAFFTIYDVLESVVDHRATIFGAPTPQDHEHLLLAFTASILHQPALRARWERMPSETKYTWIYHDCYVQVPSVIQKQLREAMRADVSLFHDALLHISSYKGFHHWFKQVCGTSIRPESFGTFSWLRQTNRLHASNVGSMLNALPTLLNDLSTARSYAHDVYHNHQSIVSKSMAGDAPFKPLLEHKHLEIRVLAWIGFLKYTNIYTEYSVSRCFDDLRPQYNAYMELASSSLGHHPDYDGWLDFLNFYHDAHIAPSLSALDASELMIALGEGVSI